MKRLAIAMVSIAIGLFCSLTAELASGYQLFGQYWPQDIIPVPYWTNLTDLSGNGGTEDEIAASTMSGAAWSSGEFNFSYTYSGSNTDTNSSSVNMDENGEYITLNTIMAYNGTGRCEITANGGARLGYASYWYLEADSTIFDGYIVICQSLLDPTNGAIYTVPWFTGTGSPGSSQYDLTSVVTHELGHLLGFAHSCDVDPNNTIPDCSGECGTGTDDPLLLATMCWSLDPGQTYSRDLDQDDENAMHALYGLWDEDGDGYSVADGDCDDKNDLIYPDATEVVGDGIDNDCDGRIDESGPSCSSEPEANAMVNEIADSALLSATLEQDLLALYYRKADRWAAVWSEARQESGLALLTRWEAAFTKGPKTGVATLLAETAIWLQAVSGAADDRDLATLAQFVAGQSKKKTITLAHFISALERFFEKNQKGEGLYLGGHQLF